MILLIFDQIGQHALLHITFNLFVLVIVWWSLQALKLDRIIQHPKSGRGMMLFILIAVAITHLVSTFFLEYLNQALMLRYLF
ncbi:hypothetical protein JCM19037_4224 [Geomicrobium sp. JCM 19037]|uniref:DUF1146 family protein n=1 Tax=unclassified Geomicrobium TaxID=2628951 RepID=UPI00045F291B|nr:MULTISPECIES: DUF1146 family protein [unclassified Geomicrobium]GAK05698.1 hypothetical protein JCM19037_4224 [Geomicrobium sp. JCM 19037]GAK13030.1 hypothetical protein JCM19039_2844 [Geomicrobium sp. JCM 19039]